MIFVTEKKFFSLPFLFSTMTQQQLYIKSISTDYKSKKSSIKHESNRD